MMGLRALVVTSSWSAPSSMVTTSCLGESKTASGECYAPPVRKLVVLIVAAIGVGCSAGPGQMVVPVAPGAPVVSVPSLDGTWTGTATIVTCLEEKGSRPVTACQDRMLQPGATRWIKLLTSQLGDALTGTTHIELWPHVPEDPGMISDPFDAVVPVAGPFVVAAKYYHYPSSLQQRWTLTVVNHQELTGTTEWTYAYSKAPERWYATAAVTLRRQ